MQELPSEAEFRRAVDAVDVLNLVIRSHGELERALKVAISEALVDPHEIEMERMSFPLKVDLAVALGVIREDVRPLMIKLNRIRNTFAHDSRADFTDKEAAEVLGAFSPAHREGMRTHLDTAKSPREVLRIGFVLAFCEATTAADRVRELKQRRRELVARADALLEETERKYGGKG